MKIEFIKDITLPDRDGFVLRYNVDGEEIKIEIAGTVLSMWNIVARNTQELLSKVDLELIIIWSISFLKEYKEKLKKIIITGDGIKVNSVSRPMYTQEGIKDIKDFIIK